MTSPIPTPEHGAGATPSIARPNSPQRNPDLDGFRGIAIALVLFDHGFGHSVPYAINGWIGVDVFFVLSGFLITSILLGMRQQSNYFRAFYARRTLRIFPAFYLVLLIDAAFSQAAGKLGSPAAWLISASFLTSVLQAHFFAAAAALPAAVFWNLQALWSVSIEELFYLAWAPLVRFLRLRQLVWLLAAILCIEPILRWLMFRAHYPVYSAFAGRLDGLAIGALIALFFAYANTPAHAPRQLSIRLITAMLLIDFAAFPFLHLRLYTLRFTIAGYLLLALTTGTGLFWLLVRSGESTWPQRLLRCRPLQLAGKRSFMLYLINQLLFVPALHWADNHKLATLGHVLVGLVCCAGTFLLAEASWRFFEGPILAHKTRWKESSPLHFLKHTGEQAAP